MKELCNDISDDELERIGESLLEEWNAEDQPIGEVPHMYEGDPSGPQTPNGFCNDKVKKACTRRQILIEAARISRAYKALVAANLAAGWVWGPQGNIKISWAIFWGNPVLLGSCSDWQNAIYNMLCGMKLKCWETCEVRSIWHKAVLIRPRQFKNLEFVLDPWLTGGARVYTRPAWSIIAGINWTGKCC